MQRAGVDIITLNEAGDKIVHIEVLIRPLNALQQFMNEMGRRLSKL